MGDQTFEEYIEEMINEGYIAKDGTPLKCWNCKGTNFTEFGHDYLDYCYGVGVGLLEYQLKCDECGKNVGYWVAGHWEV